MSLRSLILSLPILATLSVPAIRTVVIDPGHGGHDAGCVSKDKKTYEKTLALDIATRLKEKMNKAYPEVKVVMTRSDDRFIELHQRGNIANNAGGDLFISIHVNATDRGTGPNGFSVHCLGKSGNKNRDIFKENLNLVRKENAVVKLEQDYQESYMGYDPDDPESSIIFSLMQNAHLTNSLAFADDLIKAMANGPIKTNRGVSQDPFLVLARAAMPAVLIEVGFITNPTDLATMRTESGREAIAGNIFQAFCKYKQRMDGTEPRLAEHAAARPVAEPATEPAPAQKPEEKPEQKPELVAEPSVPGVQYGVQVLVSSRPMAETDPFFAGNKPLCLMAGKYYKYIVGVSGSLKEVKQKFPQLQKKFPDAYLVKIENGTAVPIH